MRKASMACGAWLFVCAACGDANGNDGEEAFEGASVREPIVGGSLASGVPEAVLIDMPASLCSGALIAPKVVLTAGHCVVGQTRFRVRAPYAGAGGQVALSSEAEVYDYADESPFVDPTKHDVAVVVLDTPITLASYPRLSAAPRPAGSTLVNIGRIKDGTTSYSNLYVGAPRVIRSGAWVGYPYAYDSDDVIESGDSGGPCLVTDALEHEIAAVNSGSSPGSQVLARVDLVYDWLTAKIAAHGGSGASAGSASGASPAPTPTPTPTCTAREREPNDVRASAEPLADGETCATLTAGDADWFEFSVGAAGVTYSVDLSGPGDARVTVFKELSDGTWKTLKTSGKRVANTATSKSRYLVHVASPSASPQAYGLTLAR